MSIGVQNEGAERILLPTLGLAFNAGQSLELDDAVGQDVLAIGPPFKRVALKVARADDAATPAAQDAPAGPEPVAAQTTVTEEPGADTGQEGS